MAHCCIFLVSCNGYETWLDIIALLGSQFFNFMSRCHLCHIAGSDGVLQPVHKLGNSYTIF